MVESKTSVRPKHEEFELMKRSGKSTVKEHGKEHQKLKFEFEIKKKSKRTEKNKGGKAKKLEEDEVLVKDENQEHEEQDIPLESGYTITNDYGYPDTPQLEVNRKRTIVNRVKEEPRLEKIIEKPVIEENHVETIEEYREQPVYEIHEKVHEDIVYEEAEEERHILPTRYEEIGKEEQQLKQQDLELVKGTKETSHIKEKPEVKRLRGSPVIKGKYEEERVQIFERPIVHEIRKYPIRKYYEQPVVRTVYEKPIVRIHRRGVHEKTEVDEDREKFEFSSGTAGIRDSSGSSSSSSSHQMDSSVRKDSTDSFKTKSEQVHHEKQRTSSWSQYFDFISFDYLLHLTVTWIALWIAAPIGVHLASQFRLFHAPVRCPLRSNLNLVVFTTALCLFGYIPGMLFALSYFALGLVADIFDLRYTSQLFSKKSKSNNTASMLSSDS